MAPLTYPHAGHAALRRGRTQLAGHAYHVTVGTKSRQPRFADFESARAACRAFENPAFLGNATMLTWVLMPDHTHWLLHLGERDSLSLVVSRLKSASARCVNQATGKHGSVWGRSFHDRAIRNEESLRSTARYLVANPIRAGLATSAGAYPFWNSVWL